MQSRIVPDMPFAEYQAAPGINASALKIVHQQSLAHAKAYIDGAYQKESDALDFGKAFHSLALEGREDFVCRPTTYVHPKDGEKPWNANATVCKEWSASQGDALVFCAEDCKALRSMAEKVEPYLTFSQGGQSELSVFAEREGLAIKCRVDFLPAGEDQPVIDLKTCRNANPEQFMRDALRMGYHLQAAFTLDALAKVGIRRKEFHFIAIEDAAPFAVCVLRFKDAELSALRMGRARYRAAFARIAEAQRTGQWSDYGACDAEEHIPAWYKQELDQTA